MVDEGYFALIGSIEPRISTAGRAAFLCVSKSRGELAQVLIGEFLRVSISVTCLANIWTDDP